MQKLIRREKLKGLRPNVHAHLIPSITHISMHYKKHLTLITANAQETFEIRYCKAQTLHVDFILSWFCPFTLGIITSMYAIDSSKYKVDFISLWGFDLHNSCVDPYALNWEWYVGSNGYMQHGITYTLVSFYLSNQILWNFCY